MTYTTPTGSKGHLPLSQYSIDKSQCGFTQNTGTEQTFFILLQTDIRADILLNATYDNGVIDYYLLVYEIVNGEVLYSQLPCQLNFYERAMIYYYIFLIKRSFRQGKGQIVKCNT